MTYANIHTLAAKSALEWLRWKIKEKEGWFWPNPTYGVYDQKNKIWRAGNVYKGPADIIGVFSGFHVEFEIKTGSGKLNKHQKKHMEQIIKAGGFYYVIRKQPFDMENAIQELRICADQIKTLGRDEL